MPDIFREVDDEVRQQKLEAMWKKYGNLLIVGAAVFVIAVGAWRFYQHKEQQAAEASAEKFEDAISLAKAGKSAEAEAAFASLAKEGTKAYTVLAKFRNAAEVAKQDSMGAVKLYDSLTVDASVEPIMQNLAKLRSALLLADTIPIDELSMRIGLLSAPGNPWRNSARELLGLAKFKAGDLSAASSYFEQIALDSETPSTMRERAQLLLAQIRGGQVQIK